MITSNWITAFTMTDAGVALNTAESTGDNPVSGREVNDLVRNAIDGDGKLRILVSA